jgi:hypothetical protein
MDRELQDYYENRFSMFGSTGWKQLIEDLEAMQKSTDTLKSASTVDQLWFKKGELSIIEWLLSLEKTSKEVFEQLEQEAKEANDAETDV